MSKEVILNWHKGRKIIILLQKDGVDGLPAVLDSEWTESTLKEVLIYLSFTDRRRDLDH